MSTHCKISYDNQIRRFSFVGTEFTSLLETIARLANVQGEFVLKYRDDESDYVTLQNQEDLTTALMISPTLLRITVEKTTTLLSEKTITPLSEKTTSPLSCPSSTTLENRKRPYDHHRHHQHYQHHRKDHRDHHHHKSAESRQARVEKKLVFINQCLIDLGTDDSKLTPRDLWKKKKTFKETAKIRIFFQP